MEEGQQKKLLISQYMFKIDHLKILIRQDNYKVYNTWFNFEAEIANNIAINSWYNEIENNL